MPGITGIISKKGLTGKSERDVQLMVDCMMHESYFTSGTYINREIGLYAGWVNHAGSFSDCMPVLNERKDVVLLFTGENFSDKLAIDRLREKGHVFDPFNASYLVHLYEEVGLEFLQCLNGWFCGILIDIKERKVVLFNDRYGMSRLYYHENTESFMFSSEAKSLLKINNELKKIDMESLGQYFSCGCTLQNRSLFSNIFLLPGGAAWSFQNGGNAKQNFYFKPCDWENQPPLGADTFYDKLRETFRNILPKYFTAQVPIAMSLTGGLDTRMLLANINCHDGKLPCYTFGGPYRDSFDVSISRKVATACHQTHSVLLLENNYFSQFPNLAEKTIYLSDGNLEVSRSYELYLNRLARRVAPIRMTGKYGGEVLRSVMATFNPSPPAEMLFNHEFRDYLYNAVKIFAEIRKGNSLSFAAFKLIPWRMHGCLALEQTQLTVRSPYLDNDLIRLMYQAPENIRMSSNISLRLIKDKNPDLFKIMTDIGLAGDSNLLSTWKKLIYWLSFKAEWYYNLGMPHFLGSVDYAIKPLHLERIIAGYHKIEHSRIWFRDELAQYVKEILLDRRTLNRPYLSKQFIEKIVNEHLRGRRNYTHEINMMLTTELIQRILIEN